jgi:phosphoglycolate phosphatase
MADASEPGRPAEATLRLTPLDEASLPELAGLLAELSGREPDLAAMGRVFTSMRANPDYHLLGAFVGDVLAGTVMGVVCLDLVGRCQPFMVVENLVVAARFRRRSLARSLLGALEALARERDCLYLMLVSGPARTEAHAAYAALGYTAAGALGYTAAGALGFKKFL